jgi:hypothetical protein
MFVRYPENESLSAESGKENPFFGVNMVNSTKHCRASVREDQKRGTAILSVLLFVCCDLLFSPFCYAQTQRNALTLFTSGAAAKAYESSRQGTKNYNTQRSVAQRSADSILLNNEVGPEMVEGLFLSPRKEASLLLRYRSIASSRDEQNPIDGNELVSEQEIGALAQTLFVYQGSKTLGQMIKDSQLEPLYRRMEAKLKRLASYTSLQLVRADHGQVGLERGTKTNGNKLVEFKLQPNARNGIEPRLRFKDHVVLRFDPLHRDMLLEYQSNF